MNENFTRLSNRDVILKLDQINKLEAASFPECIYHAGISDKYWERIYTDFIDCQIIISDGTDIAAMANSIPIFAPEDSGDLSDDGWDWAIKNGCDIFDRKIKPNALAGLQAAVNQKLRGGGFGKTCVLEMKKLAKDMGFKKVVIPVRPTKKSDFPEITFDEYVNMKTDGKYFDPWLNLHHGLGGRLLNICRSSYRLEGDLASWSRLLGMEFARTGKYIIPGGLVPLEVDKENDWAVYLEPSVWIEHPVE